MTNPIKRFFQIIKELVFFPISFLQARRAYQEMEKVLRLSDDPEAQKKLLAKMGLTDEIEALIDPIMYQKMRTEMIHEVDLSYLDEDEEDEEEEDLEG
ncbi:MAG: hypothetical protein ACTSQI_11830 [Candidatus Helarchaeota archaeon]